jgi:MinD-like ATPase involved in chromosome partitioning or flagellar assembly
LVDLDTFAPSQSVIHAREQVTAGVLGAARLIRQERYSAEEHARLTVALERYDLLSGITSHERWPELDDFSVGLMLHELAGRYEQVVIDLGGCAADTEVDPESGIRRNVAGAKVLEMADVVLLVTAADPVSLARLVAELPAVRPLVAGRLMVVVNRTRNDSIGGNAQRQITQLIEGLGVASHDIVFLPDDPTVCDQALASGVAVTVARPRSGLAKALRELAARLNSSHVHSSRVSQAERQG